MIHYGTDGLSYEFLVFFRGGFRAPIIELAKKHLSTKAIWSK